MNTKTDFEGSEAGLEAGFGPASTFTHPDEVLQSDLSMAIKRAILASWASDAHAVAGAPAMRQLDSDAIVEVDAVLAALRSLDTYSAQFRKKGAERGKVQRPRGTRWLHALVRTRHDDDDDPPPCPAAAVPLSATLEVRHKRGTEWVPAAA